MSEHTTDTDGETVYVELRQRHRKGYASTSDEVWDRSPICLGDDHAWPCDTAVALELLTTTTEKIRVGVFEQIDPLIRTLRWHFEGATGIDPLAVPSDVSGYPSREGMPEDMSINTNVIVTVSRQARAAGDAIDSVIGEIAAPTDRAAS